MILEPSSLRISRALNARGALTKRPSVVVPSEELDSSTDELDASLLEDFSSDEDEATLDEDASLLDDASDPPRLHGIDESEFLK